MAEAKMMFGGDRALYTDPVYGARSWRVEKKTGRLNGVMGIGRDDLAWVDGENVATCVYAGDALKKAPGMAGSASMVKAAINLRASMAKLTHRQKVVIAQMNGTEPPPPLPPVHDAATDCGYSFDFCSHGFYAYFTPEDERDEDEDTPARHRLGVEGVIAATGKIDVGRLGFRAERARIIALTVPGASWLVWSRWPRGKMQRIAWSTGLMLLLGSVYYFVMAVIDHNIAWAAIGAAWFANVALLGQDTASPLRLFPRSWRDARRIRRRYPSVELFEKTEEMYKKYPLSAELGKTSA